MISIIMNRILSYFELFLGVCDGEDGASVEQTSLVFIKDIIEY
ncbi:MAG: hypothetical protein ACFCAD_09420 [Pleurocapsa sp.]